VAIDGGATGTTKIVGAYGICIVTDTAFGVGAGSIPGPWSEPGWDGWFVWGAFGYSVINATAAGFALASEHHLVDSKAMRKITDDETMVLMAESQASAFSINMPLRHLFKLS